MWLIPFMVCGVGRCELCCNSKVDFILRMHMSGVFCLRTILNLKCVYWSVVTSERSLFNGIVILLRCVVFVRVGSKRALVMCCFYLV
jgi:hypothetical protein